MVIVSDVNSKHGFGRVGKLAHPLFLKWPFCFVDQCTHNLTQLSLYLICNRVSLWNGHDSNIVSLSPQIGLSVVCFFSSSTSALYNLDISHSSDKQWENISSQPFFLIIISFQKLLSLMQFHLFIFASVCQFYFAQSMMHSLIFLAT